MHGWVKTALWVGAYYGFKKLKRHQRDKKRRWSSKPPMRNATPKKDK